MAKSDYCVIGLGRFGTQLAERLHNLHKHVMVIDNSEELIQKASAIHEICVKCNATDINALIDSGVENAKVVIVAISEIETSIMVCANLKEIGVVDIIAKAQNKIHERVLKTMGIPKVVIPEIEVANKIAMQCVYSLGSDIINITPDISWFKTVVTNVDVINKSMPKIQIKEKFGATIIMIQRKNELIFPPNKDTTLMIGDIVTVMSHNNKIPSIIKYLTKEVIE